MYPYCQVKLPSAAQLKPSTSCKSSSLLFPYLEWEQTREPGFKNKTVLLNYLSKFPPNLQDGIRAVTLSHSHDYVD